MWPAEARRGDGGNRMTANFEKMQADLTCPQPTLDGIASAHRFARAYRILTGETLSRSRSFGNQSRARGNCVKSVPEKATSCAPASSPEDSPTTRESTQYEPATCTAC